jgi:hypothetical protein
MTIGGNRHMDEAARNAALERLNTFVGEWTLQAKLPFAEDSRGVVRVYALVPGPTSAV